MSEDYIGREAFSDEEWQTLQFSPIWVFQLVAAADGRVDAKEMTAFETITGYYDRFSNKLLKDILESLDKEQDDIIIAYQKDERKFGEGLMQVKECLEKINPIEAIEFKKMLIAIGFYIADASGELYGYKVSEDEVNILSQITHVLGLSALDLQRGKSLNHDLQSLKKIYDEHTARWK